MAPSEESAGRKLDVVKRGFLEFRSRGSLLERRDGRFLLASTAVAVLAVASEPAGEISVFVAYFALIALGAATARVRPLELARRAAAATPFIAAAALVPWLGVALGGDRTAAVGPSWAASVALRAYAAMMLVSVLTIVCAPDALADAMRRLRFPPALSGVLVLTYRYLFLLADEWSRLVQARSCRTAGVLTVPRLEFYSQQLGVLFLRSYERSARVQGAMTVRGFTGQFPLSRTSVAAAADWLFLTVVAVAFWSVRLRAALPILD